MTQYCKILQSHYCFFVLGYPIFEFRIENRLCSLESFVRFCAPSDHFVLWYHNCCRVTSLMKFSFLVVVFRMSKLIALFGTKSFRYTSILLRAVERLISNEVKIKKYPEERERSAKKFRTEKIRVTLRWPLISEVPLIFNRFPNTLQHNKNGSKI
jgi:hypothetical protein